MIEIKMVRLGLLLATKVGAEHFVLVSSVSLLTPPSNEEKFIILNTKSSWIVTVIHHGDVVH